MIQVDNQMVARARPLGKSAHADAEGTSRVVDNLKATNRAMVAQIKADVLEISRHPMQSLEAMAKGMAFPLVHPLTMTQSLAQDIKDDPLAGSINAAAVATGVAFVGAVLAIGVGVLAAPLTGGASLALAASAASLTTPIALACLAADGAGIVMHEVRGALAESEEEAAEQGEEMAGYVEDAVLNLATWAVGDAVQARFFKSGSKAAQTLVQALGDATNNTIGLAGVYDLPVAAPMPAPRAPRARMSGLATNDTLDLSSRAREALPLGDGLGPSLSPQSRQALGLI